MGLQITKCDGAAFGVFDASAPCANAAARPSLLSGPSCAAGYECDWAMALCARQRRSAASFTLRRGRIEHHDAFETVVDALLGAQTGLPSGGRAGHGPGLSRNRIAFWLCCVLECRRSRAKIQLRTDLMRPNAQTLYVDEVLSSMRCYNERLSHER